MASSDGQRSSGHMGFRANNEKENEGAGSEDSKRWKYKQLKKSFYKTTKTLEETRELLEEMREKNRRLKTELEQVNEELSASKDQIKHLKAELEGIKKANECLEKSKKTLKNNLANVLRVAMNRGIEQRTKGEHGAKNAKSESRKEKAVKISKMEENQPSTSKAALANYTIPKKRQAVSPPPEPLELEGESSRSSVDSNDDYTPKKGFVNTVFRKSGSKSKGKHGRIKKMKINHHTGGNSEWEGKINRVPAVHGRVNHSKTSCLCGIKCPTPGHLDRHFQKKIRGRITCNEGNCRNVKFESLMEAKRHNIRVHGGNHKYICNGCINKSSFRTLEELKQHKKSCRTKHIRQGLSFYSVREPNNDDSTIDPERYFGVNIDALPDPEGLSLPDNYNCIGAH